MRKVFESLTVEQRRSYTQKNNGAPTPTYVLQHATLLVCTNPKFGDSNVLVLILRGLMGLT